MQKQPEIFRKIFEENINFSSISRKFNIEPENIALKYEGPFDSEIIKLAGEKIKILTKDSQQAGRKLFFTFVELAQNVSFYSNQKSKIASKANSGQGIMMLGEDEDKFFFITGNIVFYNYIKVLERKIRIINSLEREELRKYKKEQRNLIPGSNGNAHIGLIMTSLTTKKKINFDITKIDNKRYFFSIFVDLVK